jgi:nitroreductase
MSQATSPTEVQPNPAVYNEGAMTFLASRRSRPAKTLIAPAPDRAALDPILTAALRVPDHGKLEPWRLIVLTRPALERLADDARAYAEAQGIAPEIAAKGIGQFADSPLAVVAVHVPRPTDKVPEIEQVLSAGALCLGLVNAALASGWGAAWLTGWVAHDRGFAGPAFDLAPGEWVAGIVHIGTEKSAPPERPRPQTENVVRWVEA